jgi:hypothetical protein
MGFAIAEERQPSLLLDGSVLITGENDRMTDGIRCTIATKTVTCKNRSGSPKRS